MRFRKETENARSHPEVKMENAVSNLASLATLSEGSVTEDRQSHLKKDDIPVSVSDVDRLIAFAESLNFSERKDTP
jgi:hypothetical protein